MPKHNHGPTPNATKKTTLQVLVESLQQQKIEIDVKSIDGAT
jgi:hypothetical protein